MRNAALALAATLIVGGCAAASKIAPYGKDTYIMSVTDSWGLQSSSDLKVQAGHEASAHCAKQGKVMQAQSAGTKGAQGWSSTSSDLVFKCVLE